MKPQLITTNNTKAEPREKKKMPRKSKEVRRQEMDAWAYFLYNVYKKRKLEAQKT
jgi:hypothetical protein